MFGSTTLVFRPRNILAFLGYLFGGLFVWPGAHRGELAQLELPGEDLPYNIVFINPCRVLDKTPLCKKKVLVYENMIT